MKSKKRWQLQEAKAEFSRLVDLCSTDGPQTITKHGVPTVMVMSVADYKSLKKTTPSFKAFLRTAPLGELDLKREKARNRDVNL